MACASGAASIALGADLIRSGVVDVALAGGVDAITRICFMGFNALKLLDPEPCRPFDRGRRGMSIGEAAAFVVLEDAEHCRARGGRALGELAGRGDHDRRPSRHGAAPGGRGDDPRHVAGARDPRGMAPGDIGYVNAHGTGTPQNDRVEALAMARVFGEGGVLVSSTKSLVGHTMAAAGSVEAVATLLALEHGLIPPTANLTESIPRCPSTACPARRVRSTLAAALSNSFGFGGQNVSLIFGRSMSDMRLVRPPAAGAATGRHHRDGLGQRAHRGRETAVADALARRPIGDRAARALDPGAGRASRLAAEVDDAAAGRPPRSGQVRRLSRICRLTVAACRLAVDEAGVGPGPELGLVVGTEHGDFRSSAEFFAGYLAAGRRGSRR